MSSFSNLITIILALLFAPNNAQFVGIPHGALSLSRFDSMASALVGTEMIAYPLTQEEALPALRAFQVMVLFWDDSLRDEVADDDTIHVVTTGYARLSIVTNIVNVAIKRLHMVLPGITFCRILEGDITHWRDPEILEAQHPTVADALPASTITVILPTENSFRENLVNLMSRGVGSPLTISSLEAPHNVSSTSDALKLAATIPGAITLGFETEALSHDMQEIHIALHDYDPSSLGAVAETSQAFLQPLASPTTFYFKLGTPYDLSYLQVTTQTMLQYTRVLALERAGFITLSYGSAAQLGREFSAKVGYSPVTLRAPSGVTSFLNNAVTEFSSENGALPLLEFVGGWPRGSATVPRADMLVTYRTPHTHCTAYPEMFDIGSGKLLPLFSTNILGESRDHLELSIALVEQIFLKNITAWDDPELVEHNPGLLSAPINVVVNMNEPEQWAVMYAAFAALGPDAYHPLLPEIDQQQWPPGFIEVYSKDQVLEEVSKGGTIGFLTTADRFQLPSGVDIAHMVSSAEEHDLHTECDHSDADCEIDDHDDHFEEEEVIEFKFMVTVATQGAYSSNCASITAFLDFIQDIGSRLKFPGTVPEPSYYVSVMLMQTQIDVTCDGQSLPLAKCSLGDYLQVLDTGQVTCARCPSSTWAVPTYAHSDLDFQSLSCRSCDHKALTCDGTSVMQVREGYWVDVSAVTSRETPNVADAVFQCPGADCSGGLLDSLTIVGGDMNWAVKEAELGNSICEHRAAGFACVDCVEGASRIGGQCLYCDSFNILPLAVFAVGFLLFIVWLYWQGVVSYRPKGLLDISLYAVQMLVFITSKADTTTALAIVGNLGLSVGIEASADQCWLGPVSFSSNYYARSAAPFLMLLIVSVVSLCHAFVWPLCFRRSTNNATVFRRPRSIHKIHPTGSTSHSHVPSELLQPAPKPNDGHLESRASLYAARSQDSLMTARTRRDSIDSVFTTGPQHQDASPPPSPFKPSIEQDNPSPSTDRKVSLTDIDKAMCESGMESPPPKVKPTRRASLSLPETSLPRAGGPSKLYGLLNKMLRLLGLELPCSWSVPVPSGRQYPEAQNASTYRSVMQETLASWLNMADDDLIQTSRIKAMKALRYCSINLLQITFLLTFRNSLSVLHCVEGPQGESVLFQEPSLLCGTNPHKRMQLVATISMLFQGGFLVWLSLWAIRNKDIRENAISRDESQPDVRSKKIVQLLESSKSRRALSLKSDQLPGLDNTRENYVSSEGLQWLALQFYWGAIFRSFSSWRFYWMVVQLLHRVVVTVTLEYAGQLALPGFAVVSACLAFMYSKLRPYRDDAMNRLAVVGFVLHTATSILLDSQAIVDVLGSGTPGTFLLIAGSSFGLLAAVAAFSISGIVSTNALLTGERTLNPLENIKITFQKAEKKAVKCRVCWSKWSELLQERKYNLFLLGDDNLKFRTEAFSMKFHVSVMDISGDTPELILELLTTRSEITLPGFTPLDGKLYKLRVAVVPAGDGLVDARSWLKALTSTTVRSQYADLTTTQQYAEDGFWRKQCLQQGVNIATETLFLVGNCTKKGLQPGVFRVGTHLKLRKRSTRRWSGHSTSGLNHSTIPTGRTITSMESLGLVASSISRHASAATGHETQRTRFPSVRDDEDEEDDEQSASSGSDGEVMCFRPSPSSRSATQASEDREGEASDESDLNDSRDLRV